MLCLAVLVADFLGPRALYHRIRDGLGQTGAISDPNFLKAMAFVLAAVIWGFVPTVLGLWLRFKTKKASLITMSAIAGWFVLVGVLSHYSPVFGVRGANCKYLVMADGRIVLQPKYLTLDQDTGASLTFVTTPVMQQWSKQNPGQAPSCSSPVHSLDGPPPPPACTPQPVVVSDAYSEPWFGSDGKARLWYVRDQNRSLRYFTCGGKDPNTGSDLAPVTKDIVYEARRLQDTAAVRAKFQAELAARQRNAEVAQAALAGGHYDQALQQCPALTSEFNPDPCADPYRQAAVLKAENLTQRSEQEIQQNKFYEAERDAQEALKYDPNNPNARTALHFAQAQQLLLEKGPTS